MRARNFLLAMCGGVVIIFALRYSFEKAPRSFFALQEVKIADVPLTFVRIPLAEVTPTIVTTTTPGTVSRFAPSGMAAWINGGYFNPDFSPSGMLAAQGARIGLHAFDPDKSAFFVASSSAAIIPGTADISGAAELIQSYPLLVAGGKSNVVADSGLRARRSAVALDDAGNILLIAATEKEISLYDFAEALTHFSPHIITALNLDGGPSSGIATDAENIDSFLPVPYVLMLQKKIQRQPVGLIVNHHLFAANFIDEELQKIATNEPRTIVLISPNHYGNGYAAAQTTMRDWHVGDVTLQTDPALVEQLVGAGALAAEEPTFTNEHGIYNIIPYIAKYVPHAHVVSIVVKDTMTDSQVERLSRALAANAPQNTIWIGSFDFSHYLSGPAAEFHDAANIDAIESGDISRAGNLDTDSRPGLQLLMRVLAARGAQDFSLAHNANSATLTHEPWNNDDTSYVTGEFYTGQPQRQKIHTELQIPVPPNANIKNIFASMPRLLWGQDTTTFVTSTLKIGGVRATGKIISGSTEKDIVIPLNWTGSAYAWPDQKTFDILTQSKL